MERFDIGAAEHRHTLQWSSAFVIFHVPQTVFENFSKSNAEHRNFSSSNDLISINNDPRPAAPPPPPPDDSRPSPGQPSDTGPHVGRPGRRGGVAQDRQEHGTAAGARGDSTPPPPPAQLAARQALSVPPLPSPPHSQAGEGQTMLGACGAASGRPVRGPEAVATISIALTTLLSPVPNHTTKYLDND